MYGFNMKYPKMSMGFSESHHRSDDGEMKASSLMPFISDRMASASFCPDSAQPHDVFVLVHGVFSHLFHLVLLSKINQDHRINHR